MASWIISGNLKYYDIIGAFRKLRKIDWRQSTNIEAEDIVYIYISEPVAAITFKCKAACVNKLETTIDDDEFSIEDNDNIEKYGRYMELEIIEEYDVELFTRDILKDIGFRAPQSPIHMNEDVEEYINRVISDINTPRRPKEEKENNFVCPKCDYVFIKNERCPDCGQLISIKDGKRQKEDLISLSGSASDIVTRLIRMMKKKGLVFSSEIINGNSSYGILKGKTSIGYRQEGIVLYCYKDGIDMNNLSKKLSKTVSKNSEATRPYKIVLEQKDFYKAIDILLLNENNV